MTTFLIILCLILICGAVLEFFYFDTKLREVRRQYRLLNQQYTTVKSKLSPITSLKNLKIKYVSPSFSSGITKENINVYFTPIDKNKVVCKLKEASDLQINQECVISNEIWLYVDLDSTDNINSRGWVSKKDFSFLKDKIQII